MNGNNGYGREFEELFKRNYSRLFYFALDWVEDEEAARDIVSDLFSDVWQDYGRLRSQNVEAYMARAVRNRALNYLRHQQTVQKYRDNVINDKDAVFADNLDAQEENLRIIESVMETFTEQTRTIFEQCYFEGKKYKEQADEMNISLSAINKHMNKAFAAFRAAFAKKCEKEGRGMLFSLLNLLL